MSAAFCNMNKDAVVMKYKASILKNWSWQSSGVPLKHKPHPFFSHRSLYPKCIILDYHIAYIFLRDKID